MQKSNDVNMKEAIDLMLKKYKLEKRSSESDIMKAWIKAMGSFVASNTEKVEFVKDKAIFYLKSAVMRKEFSMQKEEIIETLNKELGAKILAQVDFK